MLLTPHTFVGIAIAKAIPNPFISVPLSFFMHFLGDKVPHWDFYSNTKKEQRLVGWRPVAVMADLVIGVTVGLTLTLHALWYKNDPSLALNIFLCGIASVLPDALETPHIFSNKKIRFVEALTRIQSSMQTQAPLPWGLITQIIIVLVCIALII